MSIFSICVVWLSYLWSLKFVPRIMWFLASDHRPHPYYWELMNQCEKKVPGPLMMERKGVECSLVSEAFTAHSVSSFLCLFLCDLTMRFPPRIRAMLCALNLPLKGIRSMCWWVPPFSLLTLKDMAHGIGSAWSFCLASCFPHWGLAQAHICSCSPTISARFQSEENIMTLT